MKSGPVINAPRNRRIQRGRVCALVLGLLAYTPFASSQQMDTVQLGVRSEGKPVSRARIALLGSSGRVDFRSTDANGNSSGVLNPAGIVDEYVEVWVEQCANLVPQLYLLAPGGILPEPAPCPRHRAGFFILRGEGPWQVTTDVALLAVTTAGSNPVLPGTVAAPEERVSNEHRVWFQGTAGAGFNVFPGATDNCAAIVKLEPGAHCSVEDRTMAVLANGSANWSIVGAEGGFWRASPAQLTSTATLSGVPSTLVSSAETRGFYAAGVVHLPPLAHLQISPKGGVTFWHMDLNQTQTTGGGTPVATTSTITGTSPFLGTAVDIMLSDHFGLGADYLYLRLRNEPVVVQDHHVVTFHLTLRFGAK